MVDVMLVLLVIFMITAPLLKVGVPINLPKTKAKALPEDQTPLSVTINKEEKNAKTLVQKFNYNKLYTCNLLFDPNYICTIVFSNDWFFKRSF